MHGAFEQGLPPVVIDTLLLNITKPIPTMVQRELEINMGQGMLNNLTDLVHQKRSSVISDIELAKVAPTIAMQSIAPSRQVGIINGWNTKRFRFTMSVTTTIDGGYIRSYIQGYTENSDLSYGQHFDPNMKFFMNSIITLKVTFNRETGLPQPRLMSSFSILHDPMRGPQFTQDMDMLRYFRPQDVLIELGTKNTYDQQSTEPMLASNIVGETAVMSKSSNKMKLNHVSQVISAIPMASDASNIGYDPNDMLFNAASVISEGTTDNIPFFKHLKHIQSTFSDPSYFTYNDIIQLDPGADGKTTLFTNDGNNASVQSNIQMFNTDNYAAVEQPTMAASVATTVAEELSGIMSSNMVTKMTLSASNMNSNGLQDITILGGNSVVHELDPVYMLERVKNTFGIIVFNKLTMNGTIGLNLLVDIDLYGDCLVSAELENDYMYTFNIPTYADGLSNAMVMNNNSYMHGINAYDGLITSLQQ